MRTKQSMPTEIIIVPIEDYYMFRLWELKRMRDDGFEVEFNSGNAYFIRWEK